jgi:hypothetical protein
MSYPYQARVEPRKPYKEGVTGGSRREKESSREKRKSLDKLVLGLHTQDMNNAAALACSANDTVKLAFFRVESKDDDSLSLVRSATGDLWAAKIPGGTLRGDDWYIVVTREGFAMAGPKDWAMSKLRSVRDNGQLVWSGRHNARTLLGVIDAKTGLRRELEANCFSLDIE